MLMRNISFDLLQPLMENGRNLQLQLYHRLQQKQMLSNEIIHSQHIFALPWRCFLLWQSVCTVLIHCIWSVVRVWPEGGFKTRNWEPDWPKHNSGFFYRNQIIFPRFCFQSISCSVSGFTRTGNFILLDFQFYVSKDLHCKSVNLC